MKAFDTVLTDGTLQEKMYYYTQSEAVRDWINSFFKDRKQFTTWNEATSDVVWTHKVSIVQGSSIGPKLFNLYINELPKVSKLFCVLFADDTNLLDCDENPVELNKRINNELKSVRDYFATNGLAISIAKTNFIHITPKSKAKLMGKDHQFKLYIGNEEINEVEEIEFLGIKIDNKLNFNSHFNKIHKKVKIALNGLIEVRDSLNFKNKMLIYNSLIHTHFTYCPLIWLNKIKPKQIKALLVLQKKAIRAVFSMKYNSHTSMLFKHAGVTKVTDIVTKESIKLISQMKGKSLPISIQKMLEENTTTTRRLRSDGDNIIRINPKLRNGDTIYEIFNAWNRTKKEFREQDYVKIKRQIVDHLNNYTDCLQIDCRSCSYDIDDIYRIMKKTY